ncbi:MAG: fluoride efflux transporter CrcB [Bifidobacteriaceae bacterium]|jgi:CrcB protein|nr:fluoride efflux transporter CrcB [Bifidobacteriaceae bacterium]
MLELLAVGIGGFIGACARFGLSKFFNQYPAFPYGTLFSNVVAGLLIGIVIGVERELIEIPTHAKLFLTTGLLGGLSTFSTFSLETVVLLEDGNYLKAGANTLLNLGLSIAAVMAGFLIVKLITRVVNPT